MVQGQTHCQCSAPRCAQCGQAIAKTTPQKNEVNKIKHYSKLYLTPFLYQGGADVVISKIEDVENLIIQYIKDEDASMDEIRRVCKYLGKSFSELAGDETQLKFSQQADSDAIVRCLCEEVGPNNMEPLITFIEFLSVESQHANRASACIDILKKHQATVERLSQCVECTSPPTTPTYPPVLSGSKTFYLFGSISKVSPSSSPPSGNSPVAHLGILPSDILKLSGDGHSP